MEILPVFCDIDDFCQLFEPLWNKRLLTCGNRHRDRAGYLCESVVENEEEEGDCQLSPAMDHQRIC